MKEEAPSMYLFGQHVLRACPHKMYFLMRKADIFCAINTVVNIANKYRMFLNYVTVRLLILLRKCADLKDD
jgi:hypothetical protein